MKENIRETVAELHALLRDRGMSLSVAESCTGGLVCHYLTSLRGSSKFFMAGIVSYSAEAKKNILGVSADIISRFGVVSEETAREMAEKVGLMTKSDCSISTTGNLGPGVLEGKERGLVYIAACRRGETVSRELKLRGDRQANKEESAEAAMRLLIEVIG